MTNPNARRRRAAVAVGAVLAGMLVPVMTAQAGPPSCERRDNNQYRKLLECVSGEGVQEHMQAFWAIADANRVNGVPTRADQTPGYDASVQYVVDTMTAAGWSVEVVPFGYAGAATLQQLSPIQATYESEPFTGTDVGSVTGTVIPVDINLTPPRASTSGCESSDFDPALFTGTTDIALIQRGTCPFGQKAVNAEAAGAEAVIIFNQGNTPDREGPLTNVTLLPASAPITIPVVSASFAAGAALAQPGSTALVAVEELISHNVIAEKAGLDPDNIVMAGAHLDSVPEGPGINDNGSGSAALLEIAENLSGHVPQNTLRFAWWGAEEVGLQGSTAWVAQQSEDELDDIALYMNFDMVGSPNFIYMVYDADESSFEAPVPVPDGSIDIEDTFETYFSTAGIPYDDTEFSGRSDYQAFIEADIPSSGLFTGAEEVKTPEQAAIWGGTAGAQFDPCYHLLCDDNDNFSAHALDVNVDAIAFAVLTYAFSTQAVNGVAGVPVPGKFDLAPIAGPEGTFVANPAGGDDVEHAQSVS